MSKYVDLQTLREEEKSLLSIAAKLQDQLNRLKVEELALLSQTRPDLPTEEITDDPSSMEQQQPYQHESEIQSETYDEPLQLAVPNFDDFNESEEETKSENGEFFRF